MKRLSGRIAPFLIRTATLALVPAVPSVALAAGESIYVLDSSGQPARGIDGLCWRTGFWTPNAALAARGGEPTPGCSCEPDLMPAGACAASGAPALAKTDAVAPLAPADAATVPAPSAAAAPDLVRLSTEADFPFGSARVDEPTRRRLEAFVAALAGVQLELILLVGHADRLGSDRYNLRLSRQRAEAVKAHLVRFGIPANRIYTEGLGERMPTADANCRRTTSRAPAKDALVACLAADRRVEIEAIGIR